MSAFINVSTGKPKKPINGSKLVLNLMLLFSKIYCCDFLYYAGLESVGYLVDNLFMPTSPLPIPLELLGRLGEPQVHRWTPVQRV